MKIQQFTQAEFDELPIVGGYKQCPTGDYTQIHTVGEKCTFGARCTFSEHCRFTEHCRFAAACTFGMLCDFGRGCTFGARCTFSEHCRFGEKCAFSYGCTFDIECDFGRGCTFSEHCRFGASCIFEGHVADTGYPFLAIVGAGDYNRTTYFFNTVDGIYVRSGCFIGTLAGFRAKVRKDDPNDGIKAQQYLGFADIAVITFNKGELE